MVYKYLNFYVEKTLKLIIDTNKIIDTYFAEKLFYNIIKTYNYNL